VPNRNELSALSAARADEVFAADEPGLPVLEVTHEDAVNEAQYLDALAWARESEQDLARQAERPSSGRVFVQDASGERREVRDAFVFGVDFAAPAEERTTLAVGEREPDGSIHILGVQSMPARRERATRDGQLMVLPDARPVPRDMRIPVALLDIPVATPAPEPDLVNSMMTLGCFSAITVRETGARRYEVWGGRRRALAARIVGEGVMVPALVYPASTPNHVMAAMAMAENNVRRANPLAELEAIETMMRTGAGEQTIADELMIPVGLVRRRIGLTRLIPALRVGLVDGRIFPNVAELAARLTNEQQRELARRLRERESLQGRSRNLRAADVREVRAPEGAIVEGDLVMEVIDEPGSSGSSAFVRAMVQDVDEDGNATHLSVANTMFVRESLTREEAQRWVLPNGSQFTFTDLNPDGTPRDQFIVASRRFNDTSHGAVGRGEATLFLPEAWMREQVALRWEQQPITREFELANGWRYNFQHAGRGRTTTDNGFPPHFMVARDPEFSHAPIQDDVERGEAERYLPESWMLEQIATNRAAVEQEYLSADAATNVLHADQLQALRSQVFEMAAELSRRDAGETPATVAAATTTADEETWDSTYRLLTRAMECMPIGPDAPSERAYHALEDVIAVVQRMATTAARPANAGLEAMVVAQGGQNADATFLAGSLSQEQMAQTIVLRGGYLQFETEGAGRFFERYIDSNGRMRRRTLRENVWRERVRQAYLQRINAGAAGAATVTVTPYTVTP
jgi:ParB-like chromosome segregation protein Spo0J